MTTTRLPCPIRTSTVVSLPQQSRIRNDYTSIRDVSVALRLKRQPIQRGDIIEIGNGLSALVQRVEPHEAWVDVCLSGQSLDTFPMRVYEYSCSNHHGILFSLRSNQIIIEPVYKNFVSSALDIYAACMQSGELHSKCTDFIPYTPAPTETSLRDGKFQVITPRDANPLIGSYYFQQIKLTFRQIQKFFGMSEVTPLVSMRWLRPDGGWSVPNTSQQVKMFPTYPSTEASEVALIQDDIQGKIADIAGHDLVVHELTHLLFHGMSIPYYMNEGLARFAEYHITQRPKPAAKLSMLIPFNVSSRVAGLSQLLHFTTKGRNSLGQVVVFSPTLNLWFTEKSYALLGDDKMIIVESITRRGVAIRLYDAVKMEPKHGWVFRNWISCLEDGYLQRLAVLIGTDHYVISQLSEDGAFEKRPYQSLREEKVGELGNGPLYDTAFCMYEGIYQLYGRRAILEFLAKADKVRKDNLNAIPTKFCAVQELEAATHHDLTDYLKRFDPPHTCFSHSADIPLHAGATYCPNK